MYFVHVIYCEDWLKDGWQKKWQRDDFYLKRMILCKLQEYFFYLNKHTPTHAKKVMKPLPTQVIAKTNKDIDQTVLIQFTFINIVYTRCPLA